MCVSLALIPIIVPKTLTKSKKKYFFEANLFQQKKNVNSKILSLNALACTAHWLFTLNADLLWPILVHISIIIFYCLFCAFFSLFALMTTRLRKLIILRNLLKNLCPALTAAFHLHISAIKNYISRAFSFRSLCMSLFAFRLRVRLFFPHIFRNVQNASHGRLNK